MVCGLDSEYTLTRLAKWYQDAQYYVDDSEVIFGLVGTRSDIAESKREVTNEMLKQFGTHFTISPMHVFEVSSKTGEGVDAMLNTVCRAVIERFEKDRHHNVEQPCEKVFQNSLYKVIHTPIIIARSNVFFRFSSVQLQYQNVHILIIG